MSLSVCNRRGFLKAVGLGAASLALPGCASSHANSSRKAPKDKPNIVLMRCAARHERHC
jgi:hypothetical protein